MGSSPILSLSVSSKTAPETDPCAGVLDGWFDGDDALLDGESDGVLLGLVDDSSVDGEIDFVCVVGADVILPDTTPPTEGSALVGGKIWIGDGVKVIVGPGILVVTSILVGSIAGGAGGFALLSFVGDGVILLDD